MDEKKIKELKDQGILDWEAGCQIFAGKSEIYEKFLKKFPADSNFSLLCNAMDQSDLENAFSAVHTLKGLAANLSLKKLLESASAITESLRGKKIDEAQKMIGELKSCYQKTIQAIEAI